MRVHMKGKNDRTVCGKNLEGQAHVVFCYWWGDVSCPDCRRREPRPKKKGAKS